MKLLKPDWVSHDGKPIFAVDIHPDGSRFATGGQGEDTGLVIIWNTSPVVSEVHEKDENIPKMLCTLDEHTACVNCLRWSNSGKFLASGGDDKMVMLWGLSRASASTVFGTGGSVVNIENWKCAKVLRGHSGDILDICWSPDDSYIATGSIDNSIIIWDTQKLGEIVHTIKGHDSLVKGVTFDPVGKYFASQSDDKTLRIWNTSDWSLEKKITEPFEESSGTTHVLRLNWSPDGQQVVTAHAMNNGGPVAKIVERNGWKAKMDLVGHRKAITCVRFNNRLFTSNDSSKIQNVCCAIGSRDRSISVWLTCLKRPLVVLHDLFDNSLMDISWSQSGYFMICCSLDGTVAYMDFTKEELGKTLSEEEKYIYHKKTYGTSIKASKSLILSSIIENPDFIKHQQRQQSENLKKAKLLKTKMSTSSSNGLPSPVGKTAQSTPFKSDVKHTGGIASSTSNEKLEETDISKKQTETKTKDGKRRIVPMLLEPPPDLSTDDAFVDFNTSVAAFDNSFASQDSSSLLAKAEAAKLNLPLTTKSTDVKTSSKPEPLSTKTIAATTTSTTSVSTASISIVPSKRKQDTVGTSPSKKSKKKKDKEKSKDILSTPVKTSSEPTREILTHIPHSAIELPCPAVQPRLSVQNRNSFLITSDDTLKGRNTVQRYYEIKPCINKLSVYIVPYRNQDIYVKVQVNLLSKEDKVTLEVENSTQAGGLSYIRCIRKDVQVWESCLPSPITAVASNTHMVCVSCDNQTVHFFTTKGRRKKELHRTLTSKIRMCPAVLVDSPVSQLLCHRQYLLVLTAHANISIWNIKLLKNILNKELLAPILEDTDASISSCRLNDDGAPLITLTNHTVYSYHTGLQNWTILSNPDDSLHLTADLASCMTSSIPKGSLQSMQAPLQRLAIQLLPLAPFTYETTQLSRENPNVTFSRKRGIHKTFTSKNRFSKQNIRNLRMNPVKRQSSTISYLENQVATCIALNSPEEYHFWLMSYARYVVQAGEEDKLRGLCEELLGPIHQTTSTEAFSLKILCFEKRELLKDILPIIASNLSFQRFYTELQQQLDVVNKR